MLKKISVVLLITLTIVFSSVGVFAIDKTESTAPEKLPYMLPGLPFIQSEITKELGADVPKPMYYFTTYRTVNNPKQLYIYASDKPFVFEDSKAFQESKGKFEKVAGQTIYQAIYNVNADRTFTPYLGMYGYLHTYPYENFYGLPQFTNHDIKIGDSGVNFLPPQFNLNSTINQPMADLQKVFLRDFSTILVVGLAVLASLLAVFLIRRLINWAVS